MAKSLYAQYDERRRAIFKTLMARGGDNFMWSEYWKQVEELRREMVPLFKEACLNYPWHSKYMKSSHSLYKDIRKDI